MRANTVLQPPNADHWRFRTKDYIQSQFIVKRIRQGPRSGWQPAYGQPCQPERQAASQLLQQMPCVISLACVTNGWSPRSRGLMVFLMNGGKAQESRGTRDNPGCPTDHSSNWASRDL